MSNEKYPAPPLPVSAPVHRAPAAARRSLLARIVRLALVAWALAVLFVLAVRGVAMLQARAGIGAGAPVNQLQQASVASGAAAMALEDCNDATLVPLEAHIMSKCPDARDGIELLVVPALAQTSHKVNFTLSFIGTPTDDDGGVLCKHGEAECLGNIAMLCAADEYREPRLYMGFALCLLRHFREIPSRALLEDCAAEYGMAFDRLSGCMNRDMGAHGMELLRASVLRSRAVGAERSMTLRLNNRVFCVRDNDAWADCPGGSTPRALVQSINWLYREKNA